MRKLTRVLLGLVGLGLLAVAILPFSEEHVGATQPMPVNVTNTPLPVQGTVSVGNTASVNVANSPSVHVSNAAVSVNNALDTSSNPIPLVVVQQGTPYQDSCSTSGTTTCTFASLPAGMRLVIQEFDSRTVVNLPDTVENVVVQAVVNGTSQNHGFFAPVAQTNTQGFYTVHQPTTMYADAGSAPRCFIGTSGVSVNSAFCALSGYLVPAP
jgi:hypothetical protein